MIISTDMWGGFDRYFQQNRGAELIEGRNYSVDDNGKVDFYDYGVGLEARAFEFAWNDKMIDTQKTFNSKIYGDQIISFIPDISEHDFYWLCNKASSIYKRIDDDCTDSFRVCNADDNAEQSDYSYNDAYRNAITCCGSSNNLVRNPLTNRQFWIGFNYGH